MVRNPETPYIRVVGDDDDGEGGGDAPANPRPPRARWLALALLALIAVVLAVVANLRSDEPGPSTDGTPTTEPLPAKPTRLGTATAPLVTNTNIDIDGDWQIFAHADGELIRIELANGRVTRTPVPPLDSTGPTALFVGSDRAIIRPIDHVPGYAVPDGQPAEKLRGLLGEGGHVFPGPRADLIWHQDSADSVDQLTVKGKRTGKSLREPRGHRVIGPDGTGYLLTEGIGGVYRLGPDGPQRLTTGRILAVGPTRFLTLECDASARCHSAIVERESGKSRDLAADFTDGPKLEIGTISPDGKRAVIPMDHNDFRLVKLDTGAVDTLPVVAPIRLAGGGQVMVWSPDSSQVLMITMDGLVAVDAETRDQKLLKVVPRHVQRVAVRP